MTDYNYEAVVETDRATFTFSGDEPKTVMAQASRMPVHMHSAQVQERINLSVDIEKYMEIIMERER